MANVNDVKNKVVKLTLLDGVERTLRYDLNAMAELEDKYGSVDAAFEAMDRNSIKAVRCVLWAGLLHEDPSLTEQKVGSLIDMRYLQDLMSTVGEAFNADLPKQENPDTENPNV